MSVDEGIDMTTYTAIVSKPGGDATGQPPIYHNKAVDRLLDGSARHIEAWRDHDTGAPIALRVDGTLVLTYPKATRTNRAVRA